MSTDAKRYRVGDIMVEIETTVRSAVIDFADIVAACTVVDDDDCEAPWREGDGWEHEAIPTERLESDSAWRHSEEVWLDGATRPAYREVPHYNEDDVVRVGSYDRRLIVLSRAQVTEWFGAFTDYHRRGWHRAVYEDHITTNRRRSLAQLKDWYENGWVRYGVVCKFLDHEAALWGIDTEDDDPADPHLSECKRMMADDVARELQEDGYTIVNSPYGKPATREFKQQWLRRRFAYNLGFRKVEDYRAWLTKCSITNAM